MPLRIGLTCSFVYRQGIASVLFEFLLEDYISLCIIESSSTAACYVDLVLADSHTIHKNLCPVVLRYCFDINLRDP